MSSEKGKMFPSEYKPGKRKRQVCGCRKKKKLDSSVNQNNNHDSLDVPNTVLSEIPHSSSNNNLDTSQVPSEYDENDFTIKSPIAHSACQAAKSPEKGPTSDTCRLEDRSSKTNDSQGNELSSSQHSHEFTDTDSDNSDDLPDMLGLGKPSPTKDTQFSKGDIVWLKYHKYPFWPAIVRKFFKLKNCPKKISVTFISCRERENRMGNRHLCLNYRKNRVYMFGSCGHDVHEQLRLAGMASIWKEEFRDSFMKAEMFRLHSSKTDNVFDYFSYLFSPSNSASEGFSSQSDTQDQQQKQLMEEQTKEERPDEEKSGSEEESTNSHENISDGPKFSEATKKRIEKRLTRHKKIVEFIKEEKTANHLRSIFEGSIKCDRHNLFYKEKKTRSDMFNLKYAGYGPINDGSQVDAIVATVNGYVNQWWPVKKSDGLFNQSSITYDMVNYSMSVLVPEAIIFALQKINRQSRKNAEKVFARGPRLFKEEEKELEHELSRRSNSRRVSQHATSDADD